MWINNKSNPRSQHAPKADQHSQLRLHPQTTTLSIKKVKRLVRNLANNQPEMLPCPQARSVHEFKPPVPPYSQSASQPWGSCGSINQSAFCWKAQSADDGWAIVRRELKWQVTKKDTHTCINPLSFLSGLMLHHQGSRVKTYVSVCVFMCAQVQVSQHVSCSANEVIRSVI